MALKLFGWLRRGAPAGPERDALAPLLPALGELLAEDPEKARYLAAFAYLLSDVAYADGLISRVETQRMNRILRDFSSLTLGQAGLLLQLVHNETIFRADAAVDATAMFAELTTDKQQQDLIGCLYAVASADEQILPAEQASITRIARDLEVDADALERVQKSYARYLRAE